MMVWNKLFGQKKQQRVSDRNDTFHFSVPADWEIDYHPEQAHMVQANDPHSGASITAAGYRPPPGGSLEEFARIRFAPESREAFLEALGEPVAFEGGYWLETEGTWPGDPQPTRYVIAVYAPPGHKIYLSFSIVTTPADFEQNRERYLSILKTAQVT